MSRGQRTRVQLPADLTGSFEVYVNGVAQSAGVDYRVEGGALVFDRPLLREGRLGFFRWLSMLLGIAGTYRQNDSVDVIYSRAGGRAVASGLPMHLEES